VAQDGGGLRAAARVALLAGAAGSILLMLRAGSRQRSALLIVLFAGWVLSPFLALALANLRASRVPPHVRDALYVAAIAASIFALALYGYNALHPSLKAGFLYLVGPAAVWLLIGLVVGAAAAVSRR
jgi:hypothetical protein